MVYEQLSARLNKDGYKNWLKAGCCLLKVRDGLLAFVNNEMKDFHESLINGNHLLRSGKVCRSSCRPTGNQFNSVCSLCEQWKMEISRHHNNRDGAVYWGNCKPWLWPSHHWEVAKAYMPRGQANNADPRQCDTTALLNLINFCDHFSYVDQHKVREVIRKRNDLMHSSDMCVSVQWMAQFHMCLDHLLQQFAHVPQVAVASQEIQEILSVDLSLCVTGWGGTETDGLQLQGIRFQQQSRFVSEVESKMGPRLISQVEEELLRERLQDLLINTEVDGPPDPKDVEELGKLKEFLQGHADLEEKFQAQLCAVHVQRAKENDGEET